MSSGGYPLAYSAGTSTQSYYQPRRASAGHTPLSYERPLPARSPRRYGSYDEFPPPPRSAPVHRDGYYPRYRDYSRSPSPERRNESTRNSEGASWDRSSNNWQPSSKATWDRRSLTLSPTSSVVSHHRIRSDSVSRIFEPSTAWKKKSSSNANSSPRIPFDKQPGSPSLRSPVVPSQAPSLRRGSGDFFRPGATDQPLPSTQQPTLLTITFTVTFSFSVPLSVPLSSSASFQITLTLTLFLALPILLAFSVPFTLTSKKLGSEAKVKKSNVKPVKVSFYNKSPPPTVVIGIPKPELKSVSVAAAKSVSTPDASDREMSAPIPGIAASPLKSEQLKPDIEEGEIVNEAPSPEPIVVDLPTPDKPVRPTEDIQPLASETEAQTTIAVPATSDLSAVTRETKAASPAPPPPPKRLPLPVPKPVSVVASKPPLSQPSRAPWPRVEFTMEDIPPWSNARSIADALRTVVMTRLLKDPQTRDERVNPILLQNLSLPHEEDAYPDALRSQEELVDVISLQRLYHSTDAPFIAAKPWLMNRFARRQVALSTRLRGLQEEYQTLHAAWRKHCDTLDAQAKPAEPPATEAAPAPTRTTRRSAALGDLVRSDLEMEQIIASLGYDEATDPNQLSTRNLAIIPDMIPFTGQTRYTYDDTNYLVENPHEYYAPCTGIHDWTEQEKEAFLDAFAKTPKQFGIIADQLPNKTAAQCVEYYYLHKKKLIDFRRVVSQFAPKRGRRRAGRQKGNGLLSDIRQHDAEMLGEDDSYVGRRGRRSAAAIEGRKPSARRSAYGVDYTETATPTPEPEPRPKRRRVSAINRNNAYVPDDDDTDSEPKKKRRGRRPGPKASLGDDSPVPTPPSTDHQPTTSFAQASLQWSIEDKALFLTLVKQHGPNFKRIAIAMPDKTTTQVSDYYNSLDVGTLLADALKKGVDEGRLLSGRSTPGTEVSKEPTPVREFKPAEYPQPIYAPVPPPMWSPYPPPVPHRGIPFASPYPYYIQPFPPSAYHPPPLPPPPPQQQAQASSGRK
ncbi:Nuclear receptor corepressor 2-like [Mycena indigotica]|uniref:Nuclear receptor corepressor 2-like n=1 Tax=Mycena indigotica TaxID=2126181 RepID=A0A8H6WGX4_9AGAR|nr:Nuclear receptor corepressor 2-like [Mycena indigotica]KAF7316381.1 Nuclear receptor corepressor 2-like [Mycena indigotica]